MHRPWARAAVGGCGSLLGYLPLFAFLFFCCGLLPEAGLWRLPFAFAPPTPTFPAFFPCPFFLLPPAPAPDAEWFEAERILEHCCLIAELGVLSMICRYYWQVVGWVRCQCDANCIDFKRHAHLNFYLHSPSTQIPLLLTGTLTRTINSDT